MSNGCGECNKWRQKHDHIFAEVRRQSERIAALEEFLHELYHLDKRGLDDDEYDEYRLACDFGEVMKRYMDYRKEQKE